MKLLIAGVVVMLVGLSAGTAQAIPLVPKANPPPKASSFAPHPTHRRAFGAPIQKPIMHHVVRRKPH